MPQRRNRKNRFCILPGYNWCGPGCSGPGTPINDVDAACKAHDKCYERCANRCECDREFLHRLRPKINPYTQKGRHARLLYNYMKLQTVSIRSPPVVIGKLFWTMRKYIQLSFRRFNLLLVAR